MKHKHIQEIEFKWSIQSSKDFQIFLHHAKKIGACFKTPEKILIHDFYFDTKDRLFGKACISSRLRHIRGKWEITLKNSSQLKKGLATREEKTFYLPQKLSELQALEYGETKILKNILQGRPLQILFQIKNRRTMRKIIISKSTEAEVCFDQVEISRYKKIIQMKEIELEFMKGDIRKFLSFIQKITRVSGLKPAQTSKVKTAFKAFSLEIKKSSPPAGVSIPWGEIS